MDTKTLFLTAALASTAAGAMSRAQPYTPGCESRKPATSMAKAKAKKKMAQASRRKNRK
ncbi:hypothetical protein [Ferribacterium limneticum]|uniref:hypothetical protein n=1 Tax=Ferribacterium limneticum TaxID=76259 RepID=UPI001CF8C669|nr:hypothetical protein [Ferribacterium limneticum]UCV26744.1 hypothetical protein KI617_10525 [Ferribacterium limneticum]UCV30661.1 hypothetical protein KI608_10525 [Ferribacterium limneticum]